jgi:hypothetical protein
MKYYIYITAFFSILFGSCAPFRFTEGTIQKVTAGRPNQPTEYEMQFMLHVRKPILVSSLTSERNPDVPFKLVTAFDEGNKMFSLKKALPKGKYRIVATTEAKNFTPTNSEFFLLKIDDATIRIPTFIKETKNSK